MINVLADHVQKQTKLVYRTFSRDCHYGVNVFTALFESEVTANNDFLIGIRI